MYRISDDEKRKILKTFGRTEKTAKEDIRCVKRWIKDELYDPEIMEDRKILNFLLLNKFNMEKTKEKIDCYYKIRNQIPEYFNESNPKLPNIQRVFEIAYFFTHPTTIQGHRVLFIKLKNPDTNTPVEMIKLFWSVFEVRLLEDYMVGDIVIVDMENMTFRDLIKLSPKMIYKLYAIYNKVYSIRLKGAYFLNSPSYVSVLFPILRVILKKKLYERIQAHKDTEIMKELFSNETLPREYGGNGPTLDELTEMMRQKLAEHQDLFDRLDKLCEQKLI